MKLILKKIFKMIVVSTIFSRMWIRGQFLSVDEVFHWIEKYTKSNICYKINNLSGVIALRYVLINSKRSIWSWKLQYAI